MSYRADKQVIDTHTHGHMDRHTDAGDDNTRRPKLASGKNCLRMRRECFPLHRGLAIPTCITARAWRTCHDACRDS